MVCFLETDARLSVFASAAKGGLMAEVQKSLDPLLRETKSLASSGDADPDQIWRRQVALSRTLKNCAIGFVSVGDGERANNVMETLAQWSDARRRHLLDQIPSGQDDGLANPALTIEDDLLDEDQETLIEEPLDEEPMDEEPMDEEPMDEDFEELEEAEEAEDAESVDDGVAIREDATEGFTLAGDGYAARMIVKLGRLGMVDGIAATCRAAGVAYPLVGPFTQESLPILLPGINMERSKVGKTRQILGVGPQVQVVVHSALMRTVDFVKGAVSVETLPEEDLPEVAFVGRSNVGKSSLLNMVSGRAALAYSSKTPGKTQQFNYFHVNRGLPPHLEFLLVDLPGYGYAKVSRADRKDWLTFTDEFIRGTRREGGSRLALFLHLIDGRHGPVGRDIDMMRIFREANEETGAQYIVVLTKLDKRNAEKNLGKAVRAAREALREAGYDNWMEIPIIASSAASRVGRDSIWAAIHGALRKWSKRQAEPR
eukprot:scaffold995_cov244-Pinguiococcus_pyrenoidosus.AAC.2